MACCGSDLCLSANICVIGGLKIELVVKIVIVGVGETLVGGGFGVAADANGRGVAI